MPDAAKQTQLMQAPHRRYAALSIARNRFTVRERSNRRQQMAISVNRSGVVSA
ncbi:Uncharacterised protein [Enterobacter cancerogenus]|uniref:Uncharacterized protein n=1 Tax=Enterobacter cancerogenus TaxID=69218 RepID=A0A484YQJ9_9ENTR|nr:Uncharacterised protein [Enterobacter cancerogenus]